MPNKPTNQKFDDLTRDVDWQLNSLLSYIRKGFQASPAVRAKMSATELVVQNVLDAYLWLAESFYGQFKDQLNTDEDPAKDKVSDADVSILLQQALDKLTAEWARVYGFIAATEARSTRNTQEIERQLSPLIRAAVRDVGFSSDSFPVIPQFGTAYSLGFFNYTDDFMALNLPITALQSPWEWTIFWHEIAGQKIRLLKKTQVEFLNVLREMFSEMKRPGQEDLLGYEGFRRIEVRANLKLILSLIIPFPQMNGLAQPQESDLLDALTDCVYKDWESPDSSSSPLTNTRKFLQDLSPARHNLPILMFSFDDLLSEIMEELRLQQKKLVKTKLLEAHREALAINKIRTDTEKDQVMDELLNAWENALSLEDKLAAQKNALAEEGWSADWLEELFEDSFSVMNFDVNFLSIFDKLLRRHADGGKDLRHPPHRVRLAFASALKLLDCDESLMEQDLPPQADGLPAGLSNKEIDTLKTFYPGPLSPDAQAVVWLAAKKFHEMHQRMKMPHDDSDETIQRAKEAITDAMRTHIDHLGTSEEIAKAANRILASLARAISKLRNTLQKAEGTYQNQNEIAKLNYENKIHTLLYSRNIIPPQFPLGYHELLDLSFYDVDFLETTITDVAISGISKDWTIKATRVLSAEVMNGTPQGTVTYKVDGKPRRTTTDNWNRDPALSGFGL